MIGDSYHMLSDVVALVVGIASVRVRLGLRYFVFVLFFYVFRAFLLFFKCFFAVFFNVVFFR